MIWTGQLIEQVRVFASQFNSAREIAELMGLSRNMIVGVCFRHSISLLGKRGNRIKAKNTISFVKKQPEKTIKERLSEVHIPTKSLLHIKEGECRAIIGEPKLFQCCGIKTNGGVYCEDHANKYYVASR